MYTLKEFIIDVKNKIENTEIITHDVNMPNVLIVSDKMINILQKYLKENIQCKWYFDVSNRQYKIKFYFKKEAA